MGWAIVGVIGGMFVGLILGAMAASNSIGGDCAKLGKVRINDVFYSCTRVSP